MKEEAKIGFKRVNQNELVPRETNPEHVTSTYCQYCKRKEWLQKSSKGYKTAGLLRLLPVCQANVNSGQEPFLFSTQGALSSWNRGQNWEFC